MIDWKYKTYISFWHVLRNLQSLHGKTINRLHFNTVKYYYVFTTLNLYFWQMLCNFFLGLHPGYEGLLLSFQIYFILPILSKKKKLAPSFKRFEYFNIIQEY